MQSEFSVLYVLMGVIILFALIAAIGAWRRTGLKRDDVENLFSDAQTKHREEVERLEKIINDSQAAAKDSHAKTHSDLTTQVQLVDRGLTRTRGDVEAAISKASADQSEALSAELDLVSRKFDETERRMNNSMEHLERQVTKASDQVRDALLEMTRLQRDQKAQSSIQMCDALINSLGTLKSSISNQLDQNSATATVEAESSASDDNSKLELADHSADSYFGREETVSLPGTEFETEDESEPEDEDNVGKPEFGDHEDHDEMTPGSIKADLSEMASENWSADTEPDATPDSDSDAAVVSEEADDENESEEVGAEDDSENVDERREG